MGYFELLSLELGVTTSVRTAVYPVVNFLPVARPRDALDVPESLQGTRRRRR